MTSEWKQKEQHFFPNASRSLLSIRFVAVAFRSEVHWRSPPPMTYLAPPWIRPFANVAEKKTLVRDLEYSIHTKVHQNPSSGSGEEVEHVNCLTDDRRTDGRRTDGRTDEGQRVITIGYWSLQLLFLKRKTKVPQNPPKSFCLLVHRQFIADIDIRLFNGFRWYSAKKHIQLNFNTLFSFWKKKENSIEA